MSFSEIVIYGFAVVGIIWAVVAFIETPKGQRFGLPEKEKEKGVNYAPEYTKKERATILLKTLAWFLPLYLITNFWFFDWLSEYLAYANCYHYGNINGTQLVFYGLFVGMPLLVALFFLLFEGPRCFKIIKLGQNPLPNEKVFRSKKYKYGIAAKIQPIVLLSIIFLLIGASIWGGYVAGEITRDIAPCEN